MNLWDAMTVDLPEAEKDGLSIERFTVGERSLTAWRLGHRAPRPGVYTKLCINGRLWMSDTTAEKQDHYPALLEMARRKARRVIVNGLGLGMIVKAALTLDHVEHIDVVEIDPRVAALVGRHYARDPRVHIHVADAYEQARRWPAGTRWDVGWSDIWADLCTDDLPRLARLRRSYGRRCDWHDCWGRDELLRIRAAEALRDRGYRHFAAAFNH